MNSITLIGRLTKDPEIKYIGENGIPVAKFTLAVDRNNKRDNTYQNTDFINIEAWREATDICISSLFKGSLVSINGVLRIDEYKDKEGNRKQMTKVSTNHIQLLRHSTKIHNGNNIFNDVEGVNLENVALPF